MRCGGSLKKAFEETCNIDNLNDEWYQSLEIFIFGDGTDERVTYLPRKLSTSFKGGAYRLRYDVKTEQCTIEKTNILGNLSPLETSYSGDITIGLLPTLQELGINGKNVLIDITGIKHPAFFYLLSLLIEKEKPRQLFVGYTEPERYVPHGSTEIEERFQLFEGYLGIRALPGFARLPDDPKEKLLVVFLGFEGTRLQYVHGETEPGDGNTIAVVGFPAFRPGWQNLTMAANQSALQSTRACLYMQTAIAYSPFDAYNLLHELQSQRPTQRLIMAPIGTRPHALGAVLYAIKNPGSYLLHDFPIEVQEHRTERVGKCHIFHLSSFL